MSDESEFIELKTNSEIHDLLYDHLSEGFALAQMILNKKDQPIDYEILEFDISYTIHKSLKHNQGYGHSFKEFLSVIEPEWTQKFGDIVRSGKSVKYDKYIKVLAQWFEVQAYSLHRDRQFIIIIADITERKNTEEKLTLQANLLSSVHDAVVAYDENTNFIYCNKMAEQIFGWSAHELMGQSMKELFPSNTSKSRAKALAKLYEEGSYIGEIEYRRKDGMLINTDAHLRMLVNHKGEYKGLVGSFRDITQRKQKEEELKILKDDLAAEVEALNKLHSLSAHFILKDNLQSIYEEILDVSMKLTHADRGHIAMLDKQAGNLKVYAHQGLTEEGINYFHCAPVQHGRSVASAALKTLQRVIVEDVAQSPIFKGTPGLSILLSRGIKTMQATPMVSSSGNVVGVLETMHEVSHLFNERELRMLDLLARQAADAIERTIAEEAIHQNEKRAIALVEELRKMNENKNQFLSMLSHELRNPLASIMMSLSLLDRVPLGGEQARQAKEVMNRQTAQLSRLVDDLLEVTRITRNMINLKKEPVELNELTSRAVEDCKVQFEKNNVSLKVKLTAAPIYLEADQARLTQAIGNLLHNASKYTSIGDQTLVTVSKDEDNQEAVIDVWDNGLGIKPDVLPDLFLPFIQVESSLDRGGGGLGLGLAIVKGIAELHNGKVIAFSEGLGKGTKFSLRLPLPKINYQSLEKQSQADEKFSRTLRILVIDDIRDVAEILCLLLRNLGHEVVSAYNGIDGIAKAKEFRPEVLICDIGLPDMNGYEVARSMRCDNDFTNTLLIALTGYVQPDDKERAIKAGFDVHLAKPVDLAVLEKILDKVR
ncbi:PAS domain S-box protein [Desulfosporosinus sp.]|uniref:hybrid sensor histidine kinase/response regulator n=1 Tax=Desulfosporosinus sp. TaxID=157907 RepID=UPI0025C21540|nr:PAS domain S-box protein [Desulfosporosinus sp.]MBC2723449.1 PAS domain S-box protein [Desulfosporosinus sp.]MBC2727781.1 PAS domain S-box protein [Desulfosporosinus sp.]